MTPEQVEKRKRIMRRSVALGHCVCDPAKACPCELFRSRDVCECAGERLPAASGPVRLTEHVRSAGCASKIDQRTLREVLAGLPEPADPRVLVGSSAGDDAGVILLDERTATILTVDVFTPSVDDAYTFGQIAAANSVSDIYAMGGTPQTALSIVGFPVHHLPPEVLRRMLQGGLDKMREAGVSVIGGHSINDQEIKCGYAVLGTAPRERFIRNAGAEPGDAAVLTKPLGTGVAAFAAQIGRAPEATMRQAADSMAALNRLAGELMLRHGAHAATDVTGFGLLGHLVEIARNSGVEVELDFERLPLLDGVLELAAGDVLPGAVERNRESVNAGLLDLSGLDEARQALVFAPETSGGLLVFLGADRAEAYVRELRAGGVAAAAVVGRVTGRAPGGRVRVRTARAGQLAAKPSAAARKPAAAPAAAEAKPASCCCSSAGEGAGAVAARAAADSGRGAIAQPATAAKAFKDYMAAVNAPGALDLREKKLISLALSVLAKCRPCVKINARAALEAGASEAQVAEAAALGIAFGGAPAAMFYSQLDGED